MRPSLDCWQGRDWERQKIRDWMADGTTRLIGIMGIGGLGKSTLAAKIYEEDSAGFENKFWADVSRLGFTELARRVLLRLRLPQATVEAIPEQSLVDALVNHLREGEYLLVIDNLESLLQEDGQCLDAFYQQFFHAWLECGSKSVVLVTARERPDLPEIKSQWLPLAGLQSAEGAALLKGLGILETQAQLEEFAKKVEGHPLLLTLVAGFLKAEEESAPRIRYLQRYGLTELAHLLTDEKLKGLHRGKVDIWMLRLLEASFNRLSHYLQQLLLNLSVYRIPFNAAAALAQLTFLAPFSKARTKEEDALYKSAEQDLRQLARHSLLQEDRDENRERWFQFQPFILAYARQKLGDSTEAHQRAINYYLANAKEQPWQTKDDVTEYLEAFYHYCQLEQYAQAKDILDICYEFLNRGGYSSLLIELYEKLVQGWQPFISQADKSDFGWALTRLGRAYHSLGQYQQELMYHEQSVQVFQEIGERRGEAASLRGLGNVYDSLGQYQQAIKFHQQSLEIAQDMGDCRGEANSLGNLGNAYYALGQYPLAIEFHQRQLHIAQKIDDYLGEAMSLGNLGTTYDSLEQYQLAIEFYQQSLEIKRQINDRIGEASSLNNLGNAYNSLEQYQLAINFLRQSLDISRKIGSRSGEAASLGNLGNAYYALGQYPQAIEFHQQSLYIKRQIGDRRGEITSLNNLGNAYYSLDQYQLAIELYMQSLTIAQKIDDRRGEANSLNNLGNTFCSLGQYQGAIEFHQQSLYIKRQIGNRRGEANSLGNLGNIYFALGQYQRAIEFHQQQLDIAREIGNRRTEAISLGHLGNAYFALGQYQRAIRFHEQQLGIAQEIGYREGEAASLVNLGNAYDSLGQYQRAIEFYRQQIDIAREIGSRRGTAISLFNLGDTLAKLNRKSEAIAAYQNARELYQAIGLNVNVQNCGDAIERLSRKSRPWLSLPKTVASFLLRWVHRLWQVVAARFRRQR